MNVFFDVDETILSALGGELRPLVREVFEQITADGHRIYVWSGVGLRWPDVDSHQLRRWVTDCYRKPLWAHRESLTRLGVEAEPHFVVDDYEQVVAAFGGYTIAPYLRPDPTDREMNVAYEKILTFSRTALHR